MEFKMKTGTGQQRTRWVSWVLKTLRKERTSREQEGKAGGGGGGAGDSSTDPCKTGTILEKREGGGAGLH